MSGTMCLPTRLIGYSWPRKARWTANTEEALGPLFILLISVN